MERIGVFLGNTALVAFLVLAVVGPGRLLVRLLRLRPESAAERNLNALALGFGLVSTIIYLLGVAGLFRPAVIAAALVAALVCSVVEMPQLFREVRSGAAAWFRAARAAAPGRLSTWFAAAFALYLTILFLRCFMPVVHTDPLAYHLVVPQQWLLEGRIELLPTHMTSELPAGVWTFYAAALGFLGTDRGAMACQLVDFVFYLAGLGALYIIVQKLVSRQVALWAAVIYATTPAVAYWSIVPYTGAPSTFFLIMSLGWLAEWMRAPERGCGPVLVAGVMGALAGLCKIQGAVFAAAAGVLVVAGALRRPGGRLRRLVLAGSIYVLVGAVLASPWYLRSWIETGNPVFPVQGGSFSSSYYAPASGPSFRLNQVDVSRISRPVTFLWEYADYSRSIEQVIGPAWLLLLLLAVLQIKRLSAAGRWCLAIGFLFSLITNYYLSADIRYANVMMAVLALPAAEGLVLAVSRLTDWAKPRLATGLRCLAAALLLVAALQGHRIRRLPNVATEARLLAVCWCRPQAIREYARFPERDAHSMMKVPGYEVLLAARRIVPPAEKVLLAGFYKGYHMNRRYLRDMDGQTVIPFGGPGGPEAVAWKLDDLGVKWVVWPEKKAADALTTRGAKEIRRYWQKPAYADFAARYTEVVVRTDEASLRRLKPPPRRTDRRAIIPAPLLPAPRRVPGTSPPAPAR